MMLLSVALDLCFGPIQQRVDLEQAIGLQLQDPRLGPFLRLVTADAGDPGLEPGQCPLHGLNFVDVAAQVGIVERERSNMVPDENVPARIAVQVYNVKIPFVLNALAEGQGVPEVIARVKK